MSFKPEVQMVPIDSIKPYAKNAKIHTESQIEALAAVIETQGWDVPIVVDTDGVIIKGHGRRLAAMHIGLKEVPVIVRSDLTPAQVRAARLSDNQVALTDFDTDMIRDELNALQDEGFELTNIGFSSKELEIMLGALDTVNPSAFEDSPEVPGSEGQPRASDLDADGNSRFGKGAMALAEILGFKEVPADFQRSIAKFQSLAEEATGKSGSEAFGQFVQGVVTEVEGKK